MPTPKIKTFEGACKALKLKSTALPIVKDLPKKHANAIVAHYKLVVIAEALNEWWEPNWNDHNEYKYYPWFDIKADAKRPAGFGLSYLYDDHWFSDSGIGSRLCFKSRELAEYAGKQFEKLYVDALLKVPQK